MDEVKEVVTLGTNEIDKVSGDMKNAKVSFIDGIGKNGDELFPISGYSFYYRRKRKCVIVIDIVRQMPHYILYLEMTAGG